MRRTESKWVTGKDFRAVSKESNFVESYHFNVSPEILYSDEPTEILCPVFRIKYTEEHSIDLCRADYYPKGKFRNQDEFQRELEIDFNGDFTGSVIEIGKKTKFYLSSFHKSGPRGSPVYTLFVQQILKLDPGVRDRIDEVLSPRARELWRQISIIDIISKNTGALPLANRILLP